MTRAPNDNKRNEKGPEKEKKGELRFPVLQFQEEKKSTNSRVELNHTKKKEGIHSLSLSLSAPANHPHQPPKRKREKEYKKVNKMTGKRNKERRKNGDEPMGQKRTRKVHTGFDDRDPRSEELESPRASRDDGLSDMSIEGGAGADLRPYCTFIYIAHISS